MVHAHQVLQHVGDPVAALVEMRRVCRPGGIVAVRDGDYPGFRYYPDDPDLDRAIAAYGELTRRNGANWDAGRRLLAWARAAGFASVAPSASTWCFATPEDRAWWGGLWADRFTRSGMAEQLLTHGIASAGRPGRLRRRLAAVGGLARWLVRGRPRGGAGHPVMRSQAPGGPDGGVAPPPSASMKRSGASTIG